MTRSRPSLLPLSTLLIAGALAGCDTVPAESGDAERLAAEPADDDEAFDDEAFAPDSLTAQPGEARVVGHVDLKALTSAPWLADAMSDATLHMDARLGPCADVLRTAESVTFGGTKGEAFEAYVVGTFDAAAANACSDHIDAEVARHASAHLDEHPKPEATLLADGVLVVFGGKATPSRERLASLRAADPSAGQPLWLVATMAGQDHPLERVKAWASPAEGLRAHAEVVLADDQKAAEIYGKASLGLAAMSMSGELGELASAVSLRSSGRAITAELELSSDQMKTVVAKGKARHHARAHAWHDHQGDGVRVEVTAD